MRRTSACGYPGEPAGGVLLRGGENISLEGTEVRYECEEGRVMIGARTRKCENNGIWSGSLPLCRHSLSHGQPSLQSATLAPHGDHHPGLAVDGDVDTCSATTNTVQRWWQVKMETARVESVAVVIRPGTTQHFSIFVIELMEGDKALYKPCSAFEGDFLESTVIFLCNGGEGHRGEFVYIRDEREEEEHFSLCEVQVFPLLDEADCGMPEKPVGSLVTVGDGLASYSCEDGYVLVGERTCECRDGVWRGPVPGCKEVECPGPKSPASGYIEVSNFNGHYQFGSVATYKCNTGYILRGNSSRLCQSDGKWTGSSPSCNPISCGNPPGIENGEWQLLNGTTIWQAQASFHCLPTFSVLGNESRLEMISSCLADGSWSPIYPVCIFRPATIFDISQMNMSSMLIIGLLSGIILLLLTVIVICFHCRKACSATHSKSSPRKSYITDYSINCGMIVYDDLSTPHLVEAAHHAILDNVSSQKLQSYNPALTTFNSSNLLGSVVGIRSQDVPSVSERSSGDGGSEKEGHCTVSDEGGSGTEGIYATVGRRKRSDMTYRGGQGGCLHDRTHAGADRDYENCDLNDEVYETVQKMDEENDKREGSEYDSEELDESMHHPKKRNEITRKGANCSTFSYETLDEMNQTCPTYFANLRKQNNNDVPIQDVDQDNLTNTTADTNIDTTDHNKVILIKPSQIHRFVRNAASQKHKPRQP